jgi:hypothetical protein
MCGLQRKVRRICLAPRLYIVRRTGEEPTNPGRRGGNPTLKIGQETRALGPPPDGRTSTRGADDWSSSCQGWWSARLRCKAYAIERCTVQASIEPQHANHLPRGQRWCRSQHRHWRWLHLAADRAYRAIMLTMLRWRITLSGVTLVESVADGNAAWQIRRHGQWYGWHHGDDEYLAADCQPHHSKADGRTHRCVVIVVQQSIGKSSVTSCTPALDVQSAPTRLLISGHQRWTAPRARGHRLCVS